MTRFAFYPPDKQKLYESYASEYRFDQTEPTPWFPLKSELRHSKISFLTTAGLRLKEHAPYSILKDKGCAEFKTIPIHAKKGGLLIDLASFDSSDARKDINIVAPIDGLIELAEHRTVSEVSENFMSFCGPCSDLDALKQSARQAGRALKSDEVDAVMIFPVTHLCNETACLIAREIEKEGVSTVTLVQLREVAEQVKIPRGVFVNFPFGHPLGRPHVAPIQRSILTDMVQALRTLDRPGKVIDLQYQWDETRRIN